MRVLHVLAPAKFGGLERVVHSLATGQCARGHEVTALAFGVRGQPESPLVAELREGGVDVRSVLTSARGYGQQIDAIAHTAGSLKPHVVHSHGYLCDVLVALSRRRHVSPIATTVHGFTGGDWKNRLYEWLQVRSYRRFDAVVAVSGTVRDRLARSGVPARVVHTIRNAWGSRVPVATADEAAQIFPSTADHFDLVWVGRVSHEKGLDVLIRALPLLADLPVRLTVVGDGRERLQVEELSRTLGVSDRVRWAGVIPDAGRLLRAFDTLVLSSRTEGTPITLLEAMAANVPIVAASVGGVPDVVSAAEATLVPPEDPQALASAIRQVAADPAAAASRADRARARLESDFAVEPWLVAHERVYSDIQSRRS